MSLKKIILRNKTREFRRYLKSINQDRLRIQSEKKVLSVFKNAAKNIPAYKEILAAHNVSPEEIYDIYDFRRKVPVLDKQKVFTAYMGRVEKLCNTAYFSDISEIVSSSGHSGLFSYGLNNRSAQRRFTEFSDVMLDYTFGISDKKTLLINALPMGIKINSDYLAAANTGPRDDTIICLLNEFASKFEQVIIAADNNFAKNMLEDAICLGVDIKKTKIHLILGEEILAENIRSYLAYLLGQDLDRPDSAFIGSSFGIAELGLNLMFETKETISLRRQMQKDEPYKMCPEIFHYFPTRIYIEELKSENDRELVMTNLDENAVLPLIRYNTKDCGRVIVRNPELSIDLPVVELYDRDKFMTSGGAIIMPQLIEEALFSDFSIPPYITKYFRLSNINSKLNIDIQLKKTKEQNPSFIEKIESVLSSFLKVPFTVKIYPYYSFPYGMEVDYERKFRNI
ncbi:MAG: hypothetical protein AABY43_06910 [Candidatus Omnitrophota bacterium]